MNAAAKIRWLLALICVSLFLTAIIAKNSYSPRNNLESSAKTLETHLQQKEQLVRSYLDDKSNFLKLKKIENNEQYALNLIDQTKSEKIYLATYQGGELSYWTSVRILPGNIDLIKEGSSFLKETNGYYEAIKKTDGDFCAIFFIPVKGNYSYQNKYLQNTFASDLLHDDNIEIADFTDQNVYAIHTYNNNYLFSVKLKANDLNHLFTYVLILLWISGMLLLCVLTNNLASYIAKRGFVIPSFAIIALFIAALRFINLHYHWPDIYQEIALFNPAYYASNEAFPSLGDFVINIALVTWLTLFIYNYRQQIIKPIKGVALSYTIFIVCILFLVVLSSALLTLFSSLVLHSRINFDVNNVLNLSSFSVVGVLLLCFGFLIFILFSETFLSVCLKLNITNRTKLLIFAGIILLTTLTEAYRTNISGFYILWGLIVVIRGYSLVYDKGTFNALTYIGIIVICSTISSIKLYTYQSIKEKATRKILIQKLESADDPTAEYLFKQIEDQIINARFIANYFNDPQRNPNYLKNHFQKLYFDGYLSKYDFKTYEYNNTNEALSGSAEFDLNNFKDMVLYSAYKVGSTRYFYKINSAFGFQSYFAIIPVTDNLKTLGTIVVELKSKPLKSAEPFPELLIEGEPQSIDEFKGYSYAFYSDGKLLNQSGKYIYSLANYEFAGKLKQYVYKTSYGRPNYSHLIYQPTERKLIVVSKEDDKLYSVITSLTFFFLVFLIFVITVLACEWVWKNYRSFETIRNWKWNFWNSFDKILYKTRIQLSMVFAVVFTLFIAGVLTFLSVSSQYQSQQDDFIHDKIARIAMAFEKANFNKGMISSTEDAQLNFNAFADTYSSDLTLYDKDGLPLLTTQPKLYETGLVARRMNAKAFIYLKDLEKSGYINEETIGTLSYKAAYAPVRTSKNEVIGFLQLPYFSNETEYKERIGAFLNTMINVYALVFIAIGLFAIIVARQITTPLTLIQQSLSKTIYGRKNEPIQWQHNDEIGSLIKEYNNMIAALENSAQKLAQSERESAWREMAKQVAHEIKNPLTPLKLGLQLLEKSWKDKDPKFDLKFERFSKSFVEQIDSLSKIASEFSTFAKMPETRIERFDVFDIINQAVTIFKQTDNFRIILIQAKQPFFVSADKDQILRSFNNLLKNAIEAVPDDRLGMIEITHEIDETTVYIKIKDNGTGIPDALRERIFVPNFTTKSSGTGLGLALVKNAIEYAGGTISFDTQLGVGTTFYINLPAAS